jgi:hypothetical protein
VLQQPCCLFAHRKTALESPQWKTSIRFHQWQAEAEEGVTSLVLRVRCPVPKAEERAENHRRHRDRRMGCFPHRHPSVSSVVALVRGRIRAPRDSERTSDTLYQPPIKRCSKNEAWLGLDRAERRAFWGEAALSGEGALRKPPEENLGPKQVRSARFGTSAATDRSPQPVCSADGSPLQRRPAARSIPPPVSLPARTRRSCQGERRHRRARRAGPPTLHRT